jgi:C4-dicarboxylate-specific signal transduction histidine kinase
VTISHHFEANSIDVMVDKVQVQQLIFNLLQNGIEAMGGVAGHELITRNSNIAGLKAILVQIKVGLQ